MLDSKGGGPVHVNLDQHNHLILVSNYPSGTFASFRIDQETGALREDSATVFAYGKGSSKGFDQEWSHPHSAYSFKGKFIYVLDLGSDKVWRYKVWNYS